jgi:fibronectin type 3 domain-containing protein
MMTKFVRLGAFCGISLSVFVFSETFAGINENFVPSVTPTSVRGPAPGAALPEARTMVIKAANVDSAKQIAVEVVYDPAVFGNFTFVVGNLVTGALVLPIGGVPDPEIRDDGLASVAAFGAKLQGRGTSAGETPKRIFVVNYDVIGNVPESGSFISVTSVRIALSSSDHDVKLFALDRLAVRVRSNFANQIIDLKVDRGFERAAVVWETRFPGINDTVRYRQVGEEIWLSAHNPLLEEASDEIVADLRLLIQQGIDPTESSNSEIRNALGVPVLPSGFAGTLRRITEALKTRRHLVLLPDLQSGSTYEFEARSYDLEGRPTPLGSGRFQTRLALDLRPLNIEALEVQTIPTGAAVRWFTNRASDTQYSIELEGTVVASGTADSDGTQAHRVLIEEGLEAGTEYTYTVSSTLVEENTLSEAEKTATRSGTFRTRRQILPLRFLGPPFRVVGSEAAVITTALSRISSLTIDYGEVDSESTTISYSDSISSTEDLNRQTLTLTSLEPATVYRYRLTAVSDGDTITSDPRGNRRWSRDLRFTTSAEGDTLPPEITEGPQVLARDKVAIFRWATDVETSGTVFFGTLGDSGTLGTADEFERIDFAPNGGPRFRQKHVVTITGLERNTTYGYRLESTAANGKTVTFDPNVSTSAKVARVQQPPGGSGSFVTSNDADTQFPVLLSGPTVSAKTHDTAVIEWTTDEPADSEIQFGTSSLEDEETSGDNEVSHKLTLSNLSAGTTYNYVVGSTDATGNGATESTQAVFTTNPDLDLVAPEITVAPAVVYKNNASATIQWTTDEEATGEAEFGTTQDLGFIRTLSTTDDLHEITLTNLEAETTYFYKVSSLDLSSNGPTESSVLSFSTDAEQDLAAPAISNIVATAADSTAIVTWETDELSDSFVEFGTDVNLLDVNIGDTKNVSEHEITLTNLLPGTTYFYKVGSVDRASNQADSTVAAGFATLSSADTQAPATPAGFAGTAGSSQALLSWDTNTEADLSGYSVFRRTGSDAFAEIASRIAQTSYTDLGLANGTSYDYQITALDRASSPNQSNPSSTVTVTPTALAAPSTPTQLSRTGDNFLRPVLVFDNASPVSEGATVIYTLQVSTQSDFSNVTASTSGLEDGAGDQGSGLTAWTIDRDLEEGTTYYWRVRAEEGELVGGFSAADEFLVEAPATLSGDFDGNNTVNFDDFFLFVDRFGETTSSPDFDSKFDLDGSGSITFDDFFVFVDNFGNSVTSKSWGSSTRDDNEAVVSLSAIGRGPGSNRTATVRVRIDNAERIRAFGVVVEYDSEQMEFVDAAEGVGHLLEVNGARADLFTVFSRDPGQVVLGNALTSGAFVSGHGTLAELRFRLNRGPGDATVSVTETFLGSKGESARRVTNLASTTILPSSFVLEANFPNPFNPSTSIEYALPVASPVVLSVYDLLGQQIRVLVSDGNQKAGYHSMTWDGRDDNGRVVGSGLYLYRLRAGNFTQVRKMTLLK